MTLHLVGCLCEMLLVIYNMVQIDANIYRLDVGHT